MKFSLSVLIPAYNVASTVETVVKDAYKVGSKIASHLEIIVIDDGSTDTTNKVLRALGPSVPHLRIINHDRNMGYGATIRELYETGSNEWLFSLPGDGQYDATEITKLMPYSRTGDMILGWRKFRNDPVIRLLQSRIYNWLLRKIFGITLHDVNTIRLMKRTLVRSLSLTSRTAFVDAELAIRAIRNGYSVVEVPVIHKSRVRKGATGGKLFRTILPTVLDIIRFAL